jgi:hypothetical protein
VFPVVHFDPFDHWVNRQTAARTNARQTGFPPLAAGPLLPAPSRCPAVVRTGDGRLPGNSKLFQRITSMFQKSSMQDRHNGPGDGPDGI